LDASPYTYLAQGFGPAGAIYCAGVKGLPEEPGAVVHLPPPRGPNIYGVDKADPHEELRALAINQLAGVLANLALTVRSTTLNSGVSAAKKSGRA
jgi:hypothetical protein